MDAKTIIKPHSCTCYSKPSCTHAQIERTSGPLLATRLTSTNPTAADWIIAAIGAYQQPLHPPPSGRSNHANPNIEQLEKLKWLELNFETPSQKDAFTVQWMKVKMIWARKYEAYENEQRRVREKQFFD